MQLLVAVISQIDEIVTGVSGSDYLKPTEIGDPAEENLGHISHHAIAITAYNQESAEKARQAAVEIFEREFAKDTAPWQRRAPEIAGPLESPANGYYTVFVPPDGSKEHGLTSNCGDRARDALIEWLKTSGDFIWAEIQYGDDLDAPAKICRNSDELPSSSEDTPG